MYRSLLENISLLLSQPDSCLKRSHVENTGVIGKAVIGEGCDKALTSESSVTNIQLQSSCKFLES